MVHTCTAVWNSILKPSFMFSSR